jgi:acetyl-CoA carboxylase biotin carboxyl carrier protein
MIPHEDIEHFVRAFRDAPRLAEFELKTDHGLLRFRRSLSTAEHPVSTRKSAPVPAPAAAPATPAEEQAPEGVIVTSTLVGVFRAQLKPPIAVGSSVAAGKVLGFVEVMRLTNEVVAPISGAISAIFVQDGQPVEYGQPLFEIAPPDPTEE